MSRDSRNMQFQFAAQVTPENINSLKAFIMKSYKGDADVDFTVGYFVIYEFEHANARGFKHMSEARFKKFFYYTHTDTIVHDKHLTLRRVRVH